MIPAWWCSVLLPGVAAAQEPAPDAGQPDEEIVVVGDLEVVRARQEIAHSLEALGYRPARRRAGRTVYISDVDWHPKVVLYDEGFMVIRRRVVDFSLPDVGDLGGWELALQAPLCIVFPLGCVSFRGLTASRSRVERQKSDVVQATSTQVQAYADAIAARALGQRLELLPDQLDAVWLRGEGPGGAVLVDPAQRRRALIEMWLDTADNPAGRAVRALIEGYMEHVVQASPYPFTQQEIADCEARRSFPDHLDLSGP